MIMILHFLYRRPAVFDDDAIRRVRLSRDRRYFRHFAMRTAAGRHFSFISAYFLEMTMMGAFIATSHFYTSYSRLGDVAFHQLQPAQD